MRCVLAIAGLMLLSSAVSAATVNNLGGQVLVNRGAGFQVVPGSTEANPGARVVANPGGQGQVVYPDGCTVTVNPGNVYTIAPVSPCSLGAAPGLNPYAVGAAIIGGTVGIIALSQSKSASP